jgi:hypothetical protein
MKKSENSQSSTRKMKPTKIRSHQDEAWSEYLDLYSRRMVPSSNSHKKRLAIELIEWASNHPHAIKIKQFLQLKGIPERTWYEWRDANIDIKHAHEDALTILGNRREEKLINEFKSVQALIHMMPQYDKEWADREKTVSDLKNREDQKPTQLIINMQDYGDATKAETTNGGDK